jgi:hypothetical protein
VQFWVRVNQYLRCISHVHGCNVYLLLAVEPCGKNLIASLFERSLSSCEYRNVGACYSERCGFTLLFAHLLLSMIWISLFQGLPSPRSRKQPISHVKSIVNACCSYHPPIPLLKNAAYLFVQVGHVGEAWWPGRLKVRPVAL